MNFKLQKNQKNILAIFLLIFLLGIFSFFLFSQKGDIFNIEGGEIISFKAPEEVPPPPLEKSPFSGIPCVKTKERAFGIVLAQQPEVMPLSGISQADIVIEAPVVNPGGITRLLAIFQCQEPIEIGAIRSVRSHMVDLALGFDVVFSSWGGCDTAISQIKNSGLDWLDARVNPAQAFFRKANIPSPHNGFTSSEGLKKAIKQLKFRETNEFEGYQFLEETDSSETDLTISAESIEINYYYPVKFEYKKEREAYLRIFNGREMIDRSTNKPVYAKNVILMKTKMRTISPGMIEIKIVGEGEAKIYQEGKEIEGSWKKESPKGKLIFFDKENKEIKFLPGPIWIEIIN